MQNFVTFQIHVDQINHVPKRLVLLKAISISTLTSLCKTSPQDHDQTPSTQP